MFPELHTPNRAVLADAIARRFSCHHYGAAPSLADWSVLSYLTGKWSRQDIRLRLVRVPEGFLSGGILRFGRITGTDTVCILSGPSDPMHLIMAGSLGEAFVLECTVLQFGTCWVTGSMLRKPLPLDFLPGETVFALIALGLPAEKLPPRHRKEISALCDGDFSSWPEPFQRAARYVREAPSASNAQPYLMHADQNRFSIDSSDRTRLDLGVALCHADLALDMPHSWSFSSHPQQPMATCTCTM